MNAHAETLKGTMVKNGVVVWDTGCKGVAFAL